jgi:uncharacterized membrane protein YbhN (UPF0104 family)
MVIVALAAALFAGVRALQGSRLGLLIAFAVSVAPTGLLALMAMGLIAFVAFLAGMWVALKPLAPPPRSDTGRRDPPAKID